MKKTICLWVVFLAPQLWAESYQYTVDCADSWDELNCLYQDEALEQQEPKSTSVPEHRDRATPTAATSPPPAAQRAGKIFEVAEIYSPSQSKLSAVDSLFAVSQKMHQHMARLCAGGWLLLKEWSKATQGPDSYSLHYQFRCSEDGH